MMYKLLVLDMDGTLLNNNKEISNENIAAIKKACDAGVKTILCTGRSILGIEKFLKMLNLNNYNNYSITCSGSLILNNTKEKILHHETLNIEDIRFIDNISKELNVTYNMYSHDKLLSPCPSFYNSFESAENNMSIMYFDNFETLNNCLVTKMTLINEDKKIKNELKKIFSEGIIGKATFFEPKENGNFNEHLFFDIDKLPKKLTEKYTLLKTTPYTIEVLNKNCNKGTGVKILADTLKISREEIICIGDSGNDKHMIEYAGLGVAMGNAFNEIKEVADYITLTNEQNGVAHVIEKFILN